MATALLGRLRHRCVPILCVWLAAMLLSCAPTAPTTTSPPPGERAEPPRPARTLVIAAAQEPLQLAAKPLRVSINAFHMNISMFNAGLMYQDERDAYYVEMAEARPELGTDSWRVFPDGRMETTYRLKPGLTWHDGTPLSAEDFVFAHQVYGGPDFGQANSQPQRSVQEIVAPDARTLVIRWRQPYADADILVADGASNGGPPFPALPRHILEGPLQQGNPDAFLAHPYWTTEYVGLGPFRLESWERGAFLEASAFDGYVLGRPKLPRIRVLFIADSNTIVANLLAGTADLTADNAIDFDQGVILRRDWEARGVGVVTFYPKGGRRTDFQFDPERLKVPALLDLRVRQALAHAIDKEALNQGLLEGLSRTSNTWAYPYLQYFPEVERTIMKYPHDLRLAGQRLADAGYNRGADGFYVGPTGERLAMPLHYQAEPQYDKEAAIVADGLKRFGLDVVPSPIPRPQATTEVRATFPALFNNSGSTLETMYGTVNIPTAQNRFTGNNRGSWVNAEYDRLLDAFGKSLDRAQRNGYLAQMARIVSDELPTVPLYYNVDVIAYVSGLQGLTPAGPDGAWWNIHLWEFR